MTKRPRGTFCAIAVATVLVATTFAGGAFANNGNGNGNGNSGNGKAPGAAAQSPSAVTESPGNSANAPGQQKSSPADAATQTVAAAPGQEPTSSAPAGTTSSPTGSGVKPSNSTGKNTDAPAASPRTKLYGNGKTAGQIAMQYGYPANGNLHGPGNSQPHKVVTCAHRHGVDVHALKSHAGSTTCVHDPGSPPPTHPSGCLTECGTSAPPSLPPAGTTPASKPGGTTGVESAKVTAGRVAGSHARAAGALGTVAAVGQGQLPFTGFPLWAVVLAALVLAGAGLTLRRRAGVRA